MSDGDYGPGVKVLEAAIDRLTEHPELYPYDDAERSIERLQEVQFYPGYAECGYSDPKRGVVVGNANPTLPWDPDAADTKHREAYQKSLIARVFKALERLGYAFEWVDEWEACSCCGKLVRSNPDSYCWQPYFYRDDFCDVTCRDCILENDDERDRYLTWLEGNPKRAITFDLDLEAAGYVHVDEVFHNGLHRGQDADPKRIVAELKKHGAKRFIFSIDSTGQFDIAFSFWLHATEKHILEKLRLTPDVVDGPSVSEAMERGLRAAARISGQMPDIPGTIKFTQVHGDGSASGTLIPGEEFVAHGIEKAVERINEQNPRPGS